MSYWEKKLKILLIFKKINNILSVSVLFQRLYNWIKYKTLPPSTLFKNRLYIERDSKHKRIFNNFGLIFRNSKWTNNEKYNVKTEFRLSFYKFFSFLFSVVVTILFLNYFFKYYLVCSFFNSLSYFFWFCYDTLIYYFSFLFWLAAVSGTLFSNIIYSYFFFNNFSENENIKKFFSNKFFQNTPVVRSSNFFSSFNKNDLNWIFYSWFNSNQKPSLPFMENIFENSISFKSWNRNYNFFMQLYQITHLCALLTNQQNNNSKLAKLDLFLNFMFKGDKSLVYKYYAQSKTITVAECLHFFLIKNFDNNFDKLVKKEKHLVSLSKYNYFNNNFHEKNFNHLLKKKEGSFFFSDFSFQKINSLFSNDFAFFNLNENFFQQLNSAKWDRWIYRYSILHRKVIKNFHKTTLVKRLLNSGFYNLQMFDKNLWAAENFSNFKNSNVLHSLMQNYYPFLTANFVKFNNDTMGLKKKQSNFIFLNFYESSYFWTIKRFFIYNNFNTDNFKNKKILNDTRFSAINNYNLNEHLYVNNLFMQNKVLHTSNFNFKNFNFKNFNFKNFNFFFKLKDLSLNFDENSLLTLDNLKVCYWITSPLTFKSNNETFNFFSYQFNKPNFSKKFYPRSVKKR